MPNISSRSSRNNRQLVDLLTACGVTHLVVHGTSGSTSSEMIPSVQLETSGGVLSTVDMVVQRRDSPHWLRDDDDDDALIRTKNERNGKHVQPVSCSLAMSGLKMPWCDSPSGWVTSTSTSPHVGRPRRYEPHASATTPGCIDSTISLTYSMIQQTNRTPDTFKNNFNNHHHCFTATIHIKLHWPAPPVKNWRILLVQSFTARMPLLMATSTYGLGRRCWSSTQQCYLHCLCTLNNFNKYWSITIIGREKTTMFTCVAC